MRTITCLDCDAQFSAASKEALLKTMMPHYMTVHSEVMEAGNEEKKHAWFLEFEKRWEAAG